MQFGVNWVRLPPWLCLGCIMLAAGCHPQSSEETISLSGLRVDTVLSGDVNENYQRATQPRDFEFPADHGPHPNFRSEWWYVTAVLQDELGRNYGVQFTLFRQALNPKALGPSPWQTGQAYLAHLAVTNVDAQRHLQAQRFARGHPQLAAVTVQPRFVAQIEDWQISGLDKALARMRLTAYEGDWGVNLQMQQTQPMVLQGESGLSRKGANSASYYYSMPRLEVAGTLRQDNQEIDVRGLAWFDREWSTSVLGDHLSGWDWFALQLDDQRSVMAFRLRRQDGQRDPYDYAVVISPSPQGFVPQASETVSFSDPNMRVLRPDEFELQPMRYWTDRRGVQWPVEWRLELPLVRADEEDPSSMPLTLFIEALVDDQLMQQTLVYWEGIVGVRDLNNQPLGRGYMELTGYSGAKK